MKNQGCGWTCGLRGGAILLAAGILLPASAGAGKFAILFAALGLFLDASPAAAADDREVLFLGQPIIPAPGRYLVTKDLNVRAIPDTKGTRVGQFAEGDHVDVAGKAKGSWLAVRDNGKDFGFVYAPVLVPLLSDAVDRPVKAAAKFNKGQCQYEILPDGETPIESQEFKSFDFRVAFECRVGDRSFSFEAPMFISEGPFNGGRKPIYQIGLDVLELSQDYDRFFSTNLLYDRRKEEVRFDSVSVKKYQVKTPPKPIPAKSSEEALKAGITLTLSAWSEAFWREFGAALSKTAE